MNSNFGVGCPTRNETKNVLTHHEISCLFLKPRYLYHHGVKAKTTTWFYMDVTFFFVKMGNEKKMLS